MATLGQCCCPGLHEKKGRDVPDEVVRASVHLGGDQRPQSLWEDRAGFAFYPCSDRPQGRNRLARLRHRLDGESRHPPPQSPLELDSVPLPTQSSL